MADGLSAEQASRKVKEYGRNAPSPPKSDRLQRYFGYFFRGFGFILLVGAILVFIAWKPLGDPPQTANMVSDGNHDEYGNHSNSASRLLLSYWSLCSSSKLLSTSSKIGVRPGS